MTHPGVAQYIALHAECMEYANEHPELRRGQAYYVAAFAVCPKLVPQTNGTDRDPFYDDSNISAFFDYLAMALMEEDA